MKNEKKMLHGKKKKIYKNANDGSYEKTAASLSLLLSVTNPSYVIEENSVSFYIGTPQRSDSSETPFSISGGSFIVDRTTKQVVKVHKHILSQNITALVKLDFLFRMMLTRMMQGILTVEKHDSIDIYRAPRVLTTVG